MALSNMSGDVAARHSRESPEGESRRQQLTRLVRRYLATGGLAKRYRPPARGFAHQYTVADVALPAETDALHDTLSGPATKHLMQRALLAFGDTRYARLASISVTHLYNLRAAAGYRARRQQWTETRPTARCKMGPRWGQVSQ
jgi:hypothetical protein